MDQQLQERLSLRGELRRDLEPGARPSDPIGQDGTAEVLQLSGLDVFQELLQPGLLLQVHTGSER